MNLMPVREWSAPVVVTGHGSYSRTLERAHRPPGVCDGPATGLVLELAQAQSQREGWCAHTPRRRRRVLVTFLQNVAAQRNMSTVTVTLEVSHSGARRVRLLTAPLRRDPHA